MLTRIFFVSIGLALFSNVAAIAADRMEIAVIPKGTTHSFWKSVEAGARKAGKELDVDITWRGPLREDDRSQQISLVQQFVGSKVSAIVLAPLDAAALVNPIKAATANKIPVVVIDSGVKAEVGKDFASFVATDNFKGGQIGGAELGRLLGGKGKVVLLRYAEGSESTMERENGFLDAMKKFPGIELTVTNRYGGATMSTAQDASMNMIDKIREADGIFTVNESTTMGMLLALRQNGLAGKKSFVGFDATPPLVQALRKGEIQALVAQNPTAMGYLGVKTAVAALKGEKFEQRIDTGVKLVTKENLSKPEIKEILGN
ncbi:MAG TPA: substrate-binding domain-containing protein [Opitutaceae bacterium]|nr:substrate-binding domain-containing protein [Opitutaceae bacterium]